MTTVPFDRIRIVLSHTTHPGNIGAAARAMKTMGLSRLYLVNPKFFPDPQANVMASGADDVLDQAIVCSTLEEALAGTVHAIAMTARSRGLSHEALPVREAAAVAQAQLSQAALNNADIAVVFGTEMSGLSNEETLLCQCLAHIPANPAYSSLNLAAAVQIMAYELRVAAGVCSVPAALDQPLATHDEIEAFYQHLEEVLIELQFLNPNQPRKLMPRLRRLFGRARLEHEEAQILRGILAAIQVPSPYGKK